MTSSLRGSELSVHHAMSFFTSLTYYRPWEPPPMTADDLGRFITQIRDAGVLTDDGFQLLHVRYGDSIDQDENDTSWDEEVVPGVSVMHEIQWDVDLPNPTGVQEIINALATDNRRIYRACASLGTPIDAVLQPISRTDSPENDRDFCPDSLSVHVGPINTFSLSSDVRAFVGWIGVSLSGHGYLFPWTFQDVLLRLEETLQIQRITDVCQSFWPVPSQKPERRIVQARRQFGDLWPYADLDRHWDWYWGLQESG